VGAVGYGRVRPFVGSGLFQAARGIEERTASPTAVTRRPGFIPCLLVREKISRHYETEYYRGDSKHALPDTLLPAGLSAKKSVSLPGAKGAMLRQELWLRTGQAKTEHPLQCRGDNYEIRLFTTEDNRYGVFFVTPARSYRLSLRAAISRPLASTSDHAGVMSWNVIGVGGIGYTATTTNHHRAA